MEILPISRTVKNRSPGKKKGRFDEMLLQTIVAKTGLDTPPRQYYC